MLLLFLLLLLLLLALAAAAVQCAPESDAGSSCTAPASDHLETELRSLNLTETQRELVQRTWESAHIGSNATLLARAKASRLNVTAHLVYRYLQSSEWVGHYHGRQINESIVETVEWRHGFDFASLDAGEFSGLVKQGLAYVAPVLDNKGRSIIYVRGSHEGKRETPETYLRLLMYSVERADRLSVDAGAGGRGEFVAMINLKNFSPLKCPPMSSMIEGIALLKKHYPYRLGAIFFVNAGIAFDWLWRVFKPLIPARALRKTFFLTSRELSEGLVLEREMGRANVEIDFGGTRAPQPLVTDDDYDNYVATGFWKPRPVPAAV